MFGYIVANREALSLEEQAVYERIYCGLCHDLGTEHGAFCRMTLSYDMTFLAMVLEGCASEESGKIETERCLIKPKAKHPFYTSEATAYAAAMNIALTYHKCLDDWHDDGNILRLGESKLFETAYTRVAKQWPVQCLAIETGLREMAALERSGEMNPDKLTAIFGRVMGVLFVKDETDENAPLFRAFGDALGRFIYIMDAVMDLKEDLKKERYNPLTAMSGVNFKEILSMLLAQCVEAYFRLPPNRYHGIIENILYSGVWIRYGIEQEKQNKEENKGDQ